MIYLDTNIFIYPHTGDDNKAQTCSKIIEKSITGEIEAGSSVLTWDEFHYSLIKKLDKEKATALSKDFISIPNLAIFETNLKTISKAQALIEIYNLKPRDAIHAATAILNGCDIIISDDPDFDRVKELKRIAPEKFK